MGFQLALCTLIAEGRAFTPRTVISPYGYTPYNSLRLPAPSVRLSICVSVCLSVCPRAYLWNRWTDPHEILYAYPLWPWLGPPLMVLRYFMYFWFYG